MANLIRNTLIGLASFAATSGVAQTQDKVPAIKDINLELITAAPDAKGIPVGFSVSKPLIGDINNFGSAIVGAYFVNQESIKSGSFESPLGTPGTYTDTYTSHFMMNTGLEWTVGKVSLGGGVLFQRPVLNHAFQSSGINGKISSGNYSIYEPLKNAGWYLSAKTRIGERAVVGLKVVNINDLQQTKHMYQVGLSVGFGF